MLKQLYAWLQWLISATALPTRDELDAELDRLSPPPSWPVNPVPLPPRMSHTVPMLPDKSDINPPLGAYCGCYRCRKDRELPRESFGNDFSAWHLQSANARMILCAKCGCKRCPHATDHRNECTDSNDSGQVGSQFHPDFTTGPSPTLPVASPQEQRESWDVLRSAIQHLPPGPPDTTEGDEPTRLADTIIPPHRQAECADAVLRAARKCHVATNEPSTAPAPHPAAHDAQAARGRSCFQPHIAKGHKQ